MTPIRVPLRLLFLGCGVAARIHSRVLRGMPNVECSYASRDRHKAEALRAEFGGVSSFGSYEDGLARSQCQVAVVATPTAAHFDLTMMALQFGRHVIVEKPAFLTVVQATIARDAALAAGLQLFVAENYAYKPLTAVLRDAVESGSLGEVRFVSLNATKLQRAMNWRAEPALSGGGALFESGVHWISFAARLGLDIAGVQGFRAGALSDAERSSLVVFRYTNGAVGTLIHSWELRAPFGGARLSKIQGTRGAITFESNGFASTATGRFRHAQLYLRDTLGYRAMLTDFVRSIHNGSAPLYTFDMARQDLHLLESAQADVGDSESGRVIRSACRTTLV